MKHGMKRWAPQLLASFVLLACSSSTSDEDSSPNTQCTPGRQESCACPGGGEGVQVCKQDGSGYEGCGGCPGAGGSGGAVGGMGGSGGTGGATGGTGGTGGATGGTGGTGGTSGTGGTGGNSCGNPTGGPAMVETAAGFCIDATEVTRNQYASWLAKNPSTSGQPSYCSWNNSYTPSCEWPAGTKGDHPVVCVDWCDAYAYCKAVGKRLCGKIGGGTNAFGDYANASVSQWYAACSSGGQFDYPYGDTYSGSTCNGDDAGNAATLPVASMSGCQASSSGYTGVYDLSGNVWEWEDSSNGNFGKSDPCQLRGGSFDLGGPGSLRCADGGYYSSERGYRHVSMGFRCCSDP